MENKRPGTIRVASYNIRKCIGLDRRRMPERTVEVIAGLHADVVAIQEADKRLGNRPAALTHSIVESHTHLRSAALADNAISLGWHGNAILIHRQAEIVDCDRLDLPFFEPRGAVLTDLNLHGQMLRIVGVHLGLMRRHRLKQLQALAKLLQSRPKMPTIILGDFNEWSPHRGLEPLNKHFTLCAPGATYHASRPVAALDRIAFSHDVKITHAGVYHKSPAHRASDHLPVWADIQLT